MCTYNITLSDTLVENARPAFGSDGALRQWMQEQVSMALERFIESAQLDGATYKENEQCAAVKESLTKAFDELHSGQARKDARRLFS